MRKYLVVFGTRPEAIKMAPLILRLQEEKNCKVITCVTAQHREMLDGVLAHFSIKPDYDLDLMSAGQTVTEITTRVLNGLEPILIAEKPDFILVHGDTTTTFASALAGFYQQIPVAHVEAGLRSNNIYSPYPEEMNRRLTDTLASLFFAPTTGNRQNLVRSGVAANLIHVTGNTVIDALLTVVDPAYRFQTPLLKTLAEQGRRLILLTAHRRENWGEAMRGIFAAIKSVLDAYPGVDLVFPVHPNPAVRREAAAVLEPLKNAYLVPPLDYVEFANLMARSYLVLTDSGGIQEEAPALGKPVIVLRRETERPEAVEAGTVKIAGLQEKAITRAIQILLDDESEYAKMARAVNPYGDGKASAKIARILAGYRPGASPPR